MSEFLKRNKKKGALAFLLLLLQRGKGLGPLLFLLLMLSFFFVAPSGMFMNSPWLDSIGRRLGLRGELGSGGDSTDMLSFADSLRGGKGAKGMGLVGGWFGLGGGSAQYGKTSTDMVKAGKEIAEGANGGDRFYDGVAKGAGQSVGGVLRPEDATKMESGVAVSEQEMQNGLLAQAFAGQVHGGLGGVNDLGNNLKGSGASSGAFSPRAADPRGDVVGGTFGANRLLGNGYVPKNASSGQIGWKGGKLEFTMKAAGLAPHGGSQSVMYQLAEGKAYSVAAAPPPGNCDPGNCPGEFASNASGAVFDGGHVKGDIISSSQFGDPGVNVPDQGQIDTLTDQASQAEQDAQKCDQAEQTYGPQERQKMDQIQQLSNQLNSMGCNSGGCSSSKYHACMAVGDQMKVVCGQYNQIEAAKYAACPLMQQSGSYSQMDCNQ